MTLNEFDVIVVGAGVAGLCCAGELVLSGSRVLLISETKEVGYAVKPHMIDGNSAVMQAPTHMNGWGGGWWPALARRLNADIHSPRGFNALGYNLAVEGTGQIQPLTQGAITASSLNAALARLAGEIDPGFAAAFNSDCEQILHTALNIPYQQLATMDRIRMADWLEDQKADELVAQTFLMMGAGMYGSTMEFMRREASVYGVLGLIRTLFCAEGSFGWVYPDNRAGVAVPLARAIEGHGGTIWRGRKVASLISEGDAVRGVTLADGTEARASIVAMATGNARTDQLVLDQPEEVAQAIYYSENVVPHYDYHLLSVLEDPILPADFTSWVGVLNREGSLLAWLTPMHATTPWGVAEGKQLVESAITIPAADGDAEGADAVFTRLEDLTESFFPGFKAARGAIDRYNPGKPGNLWFGPICAGPKLPRTLDSVPGLWFVGEGSTPTCGMYMEGAASAGILGARQMIATRNGNA